VREIASHERAANIASPTGQNYNAQHVWLTMQVFINPAVAALPEHAHLFAEHGCYTDGLNGFGKECGTGRGGELETPLPDEFKPLNLTQEMDDAWVDLVRRNIATKDKRVTYLFMNRLR